MKKSKQKLCEWCCRLLPDKPVEKDGQKFCSKQCYENSENHIKITIKKTIVMKENEKLTNIKRKYSMLLNEEILLIDSFLKTWILAIPGGCEKEFCDVVYRFTEAIVKLEQENKNLRDALSYKEI
jgi:hypothetical protein